MVPLRSPKNWILNFGLKLCTHEGFSEDSLWWTFQRFRFFLSWNMNIEILTLLYKRCVISQERNNQTRWNFHHKLFALRPSCVQSFKPKFKIQFLVTWGDHRFLLKNSVKLPYLKNRASENRIILDFWITHYTGSNEHSDNQKSILHLERFPRKIQIFCIGNFNVGSSW